MTKHMIHYGIITSYNDSLPPLTRTSGVSPAQAFTGEVCRQGEAVLEGEPEAGEEGALQETASARCAAGARRRHKRLSAPWMPGSGSQGGGGSMKLGGRGTERNLVSIWLQQSAWLGLGLGLGLGVSDGVRAS